MKFLYPISYLWISVLGFCLVLSTLPVHSENPLKNADGFKLSLFNKDTGHRFLRLHYKEAQSDNPKLGFLKMRLSLLKVRNLYLEIDLRHTSPDRLMGLFSEVSQKKGIRFATAEPIHLRFTGLQSEKIEIRANKGKFSADGSLKLWDNVIYKNQEGKKNIDKLSLSINILKKAILVNLPNNLEILPLSL